MTSNVYTVIGIAGLVTSPAILVWWIRCEWKTFRQHLTSNRGDGCISNMRTAASMTATSTLDEPWPSQAEGLRKVMARTLPPDFGRDEGDAMRNGYGPADHADSCRCRLH